MRLPFLLPVTGLVLSLLSFVACGASEPVDAAGQEADATSLDAGALDAAPTNDAGGDAAKVTPPPLPVIPNQGGKVIAKPELVTITWSSDPIAGDLEAFDAWLAKSDLWTTMMAEWGVGPGTYSGSKRIPTAAPATLDEAAIDKLLRAGFADGTLPAPNGSRIYMIYPPPSTVVTQGGSYQGCRDFQAYHLAIEVPASGTQPATRAYYGVTPRCAETSGLTPLDYTTWGASHEAMEAASDPGLRQAGLAHRRPDARDPGAR